MKKNISILSSAALLIALSLSVSGCSSSQTGDSEFGEDVPADAGTDAVPAEHAENPASTDQTQAQADAPKTENTDPAQAQAQSDQTQQPMDQQLASSDQQPQPPADPQAAAPAADQATPAPAPLADQQPSAPIVAEAPVAHFSESQTPPAEPAPEAKPASSGSGETYAVRHGDTLMRIAFEKYGDLYKWKQIYEANRDKIKDPNVIIPGTVLALDNVSNDLPARSGKRYMIKQGDTLARISNNVYGTPRKWKKIWEHNKPWIPNPNKIFAGFYLYYTGGKNPEDIEQHEEQNPVAPVAESAPEQAPREPASAVQAAPVAPSAPAAPAAGMAPAPSAAGPAGTAPN